MVVIIFIIYLFLQEWYKKNYETSLFNSQDDLYNLLHFIYNGRMTGLNDSALRKKLAMSGWSNEQLDYAFRKIDGRRTGMWEIPIFKVFENNKVKNEIAKRQAKEGGARFIKR